MNDFNFIVVNRFATPKDIDLFFGDEYVHCLHQSYDMSDILVICGIFKSKTQARKNWKHGMEIPKGFSEFKNIGKLRKSITILNPMEEK